MYKIGAISTDILKMFLWGVCVLVLWGFVCMFVSLVFSVVVVYVVVVISNIYLFICCVCVCVCVCVLMLFTCF